MNDYGIRLLFVLILFAHLVISQTCGGSVYLNNATGNIIVGSYNPNSYCTWELSPPNAGYTYVQITFNTFDTWPDADWINVYNGPSESSPRILRWSGWDLPYPSTFYSTQPSMTITFTSDENISGSGFSITYQWLTGTPPPCSGTIEMPVGGTQLDLQYSSLPPNFECVYLLQSKWSSSNYDYTATVSLISFNDPSSGLLVQVYGITPDDTIQWYDWPMVSWSAFYLDFGTYSESFYGEAPGLQVKVSGNASTTQTTSVSISYTFTRGDNLYGTNQAGMIIGIVFGSFFLFAILAGAAACHARSRVGGLWISSNSYQGMGSAQVSFFGFGFGRYRGSESSLVPQTTTTVIHTTPLQPYPPTQAYPQQTYPAQVYPPQGSSTLPPVNPEYLHSQSSANPYPYYGST